MIAPPRSLSQVSLHVAAPYGTADVAVLGA
jgi:hypothetical protein